MHNMNIELFSLCVGGDYCARANVCVILYCDVLHMEVFIFSSAALCVSMKKSSGPELACTFSKSSGGAGQGSAPIISVPTQTRASQNGFEYESTATSYTDQPIFFRCVYAFACDYSHKVLIVLGSHSITQSLLMMIYMVVFAYLFQRVQVHF